MTFAQVFARRWHCGEIDWYVSLRLNGASGVQVFRKKRQSALPIPEPLPRTPGMPAKKNRTAKARATIVCLRNGKVLLVRKKGARWNLPGGVIEPGETPEEAAIRELREEASLHCQGLHALCTLPVGNVLHHIFTINLGERTRPVPSNEIVACKWCCAACWAVCN